ncbi:RNA 2',3'-cyclic phosphodiesterase [Syntrophomonas palmitatica]|uniref:RNA 2',3'-cyclic phosphodiesterase n=1 Tax=Syntrophomonas palmitatica TaxID=402877 RepID=UPI0006D26E23|nr:RNA 2',3'-cyclic phosphodiesterase [Syntrophomonas palmitatica]
MKWVEYENYHITLKFLGESKTALSAINDKLSLAAQACPEFDLTFCGIGFFPSRHRPRVIWIGTGGEIDKALFLGERIDTYLSEIGFEPEKSRNFHLTLGRIRSDKNLDSIQIQAGEIERDFQSIPYKVKKFYLMESQLSPQGPKYLLKKEYVLQG